MFRVLELFSANIRIYKACKHTSYLTVLVKIEEIQAIRGGDNLMVLTTGYLHSSFSDVPIAQARTCRPFCISRCPFAVFLAWLVSGVSLLCWGFPYQQEITLFGKIGALTV